jgi:hypothetical protein
MAGHHFLVSILNLMDNALQRPSGIAEYRLYVGGVI